MVMVALFLDRYGYLLDLVSTPDHRVRWNRLGDAEGGHVYDEIYVDKSGVPHNYRPDTVSCWAPQAWSRRSNLLNSSSER